MTSPNSGLPDDLDLLAHLLEDAGPAPDAPPVLAPRPPGERVPMSFAQELLFLLDEATPGLAAYNVTNARRLTGRLDVPALEEALGAVTRRHEMFRTRLARVDGEPAQLVDAAWQGTLERVDLTGTPADGRADALQAQVRARSARPFAFATDHLLRATLFALAPAEHVLLLVSHHAAVDGATIGILMRDLAAAYNAVVGGGAADLPPVRIQFGDYARWQRQVLAGPRLERLLAFWREQLGPATEPLRLPTDFPRGAAPTFAGASTGVTLTVAEVDALKAFARAHDATPYMVLLAAYATVLHRYAGAENVLVGSAVAGRMAPGIEETAGYFNNTVVQRADFSGDPTFAALIGRVRLAVLGAFDHQEVPLEKLVLELRAGQPARGTESLYQAVFTMQDPRGTALHLEGLDVAPVGADTGETKFDVTLLPTDREDGMRLSLHYRSELFAATTAERMVAQLRQVLLGGMAAPQTRVSALALRTPDEVAATARANDTRTDVGAPGTLVEAIAAASRAAGTRVAVTDGEAQVTHAELLARAGQLAHALREAGVTPGAPVALLLDRQVDAIVAITGILASGGAYVPVPPELPPARIEAQVRGAGAQVAVCLAASRAHVPPGVACIALDEDAAALVARPTAWPASGATPDTMAYGLFTSGSTGRPKAVAVTHGNALHYARAIGRVLAGVPAGTPGDGLAALAGWHFGLVSTLGADLGNTSLLPALLAGGTLHVLPRAATTEPERFRAYLRAHPLDVLKATPGHLRALTAGTVGSTLGELLPSRWIVLGGEALPVEFARMLLGAGRCRVLNHYGPTETTVGALTFEATTESLREAAAQGAQTVPIGRPLANMAAHVVDAHGAEQPLGVPGELWLAGDGVTAGYLGLPEMTAERFVLRDGVRCYRTGDRVRRLPSQAIEFLGRLDDQAKVRGFRVEPGELAHALEGHPGVQRAVAVVREGDAGAELVAYAVLRDQGYAVSHAERPDGASLRAWLSERLPDALVPAHVLLIDAVPLTPNGKVDRAALPEPGASAAQAVVPPSTETERQLLAIWQEVLKKPDIGVTHRFTDLGGHSLLAIRILGRISKTFGVRLALGTLFETPTVAQLAELVDVERQLAALDAVAPPPRA